MSIRPPDFDALHEWNNSIQTCKGCKLVYQPGTANSPKCPQCECLFLLRLIKHGNIDKLVRFGSYRVHDKYKE